MGYCMKAFPALVFCIVLTFVLAACGGGAGGAPKTGGASTLTAQSAADIANCPTGGVALDYGIDDNKNGALDASEIDGTEYICNGTAGADGTDGLTTLVATSPADIANCPAGGTMIEIGIDANSNDVLDPGEADPALTDYVCNPTAPANTAPVADAGPDQTASAGLLVTLDGSGSSDAELDSLSYVWSFVMTPAGSTAVLNDTSAESPTFTPDIRGAYVLSLSVGDGWLFSAPDYVTITAKAWGTAELIETGGYGAYDPQVAFDANGNAVAVWRQSDGTRYNIHANRYVAGKGWGTAEIIETGANSALYPQVAVDAEGNAIAVWRQSDGSFLSIYANRYDAGTGQWGTAAPIETVAYNLNSYPQVAFDSNGNAFAVWADSQDVYANRYVAGTGWGTAEIIETSTGSAYAPQVAFDANGNAFAVWRQHDGASLSIHANRYVAGTGWTGAGVIETDAGTVGSPQVAFDAGGNAIAVWNQWDGTSAYDIHANIYNGTDWEGAEIIDAGGDSAEAPQVAFDANGNAIAVWRQHDGTSVYDIHANRYVAGTGWTGAEIIDAGGGNAESPQVAVDASGNAVAVWSHWDGTSAYDIHANRYIAGKGWGTAELIETGAGSAYAPQVAVDASGNAAAVWYQSTSIHANRYE